MPLEILMLTFWLVLAAYLIWYIFKAKTIQPLTLDDLALTWKIHKQQKGCKAEHIHSLIKQKDQIIGFKCECGYKFVQKRPITQRPQKRRKPFKPNPNPSNLTNQQQWSRTQ